MIGIRIIGAKPYRIRHDDLRTQRVHVELDMTVEDYIKLRRRVESDTLFLEDPKDETELDGDTPDSDVGGDTDPTGGTGAPSAGGALADIIQINTTVKKV